MMRRLTEAELARQAPRPLAEAREASAQAIAAEVLATFARSELSLDAAQAAALVRKFHRAFAARRSAP